MSSTLHSTTPTDTATHHISCHSEVQKQHIEFSWAINDFQTICPPETHEFEPISTPPFRAGQQIHRDSEWTLNLKTKNDFLKLTIHLQKTHTTNAVSLANLKVFLIMKDGDTLNFGQHDSKFELKEGETFECDSYIRLRSILDNERILLVGNQLRIEIRFDLLGDVVGRIELNN